MKKKKNAESDVSELVRQQAFRLLDFCARSRKELAQKLASKGFGLEHVEPLLERLEELGLLDDAGFAKDRARAMLLRKGWGPRKLRANLRKRGVDSMLIDEAIELAYSEISQEDLIMREVTKRFGSQVLDTDFTPSVRQKAYRFLLGRGFDPDLVHQVMNSY